MLPVFCAGGLLQLLQFDRVDEQQRSWGPGWWVASGITDCPFTCMVKPSVNSTRREMILTSPLFRRRRLVTDFVIYLDRLDVGLLLSDIIGKLVTRALSPSGRVYGPTAAQGREGSDRV